MGVYRETHSYPHPDFAETLIGQFSGPWTTVTPALRNANPNGALSWAGFLSDYGPWIEGLPASEIESIPIHNAAFKRDALLALEERLGLALALGDELPLALKAGGHKSYFEPRARVDHVNVAMPRHWWKERFAAGMVIAHNRSRRWSLARRAFYGMAAPLIAVVLYKRVLPGAWITLRQKHVPASTAFWIAVAMAVRAGGELVGLCRSLLGGMEAPDERVRSAPASLRGDWIVLSREHEERNMPEPKLSVVLPTDTYTTIRPVIERLRLQTVHKDIEIVLAAPSGDSVRAVVTHQKEFAGVRIVEVPTEDLSSLRAAAIREATAEWVFVGRTHSYPHPGFAEELMQHFSGPWSIIMPGFCNANPNGGLSWAGFLSDYGRWVEGLPLGEMANIPLYNAAFRRQVLLELGDRLAPALSPGDELSLSLRAGGHRAYFEPAARLDHVNVAPLWHWVKERFAAGVMIANGRSRRWSFTRRGVYIVGSPLIPFVLYLRILPGTWRTIRLKRPPLSTLFWIAAGMVVKTGGEVWVMPALRKGIGTADARVRIAKLAYAGRS